MVFNIRCAKCAHGVQKVDCFVEDFCKVFVIQVHCHGETERMEMDYAHPFARYAGSGRSGQLYGTAFEQKAITGPKAVTVNGNSVPLIESKS